MSTEYTKTTWQTGDIITADKMNNIENGIKGIEGDITTLSGMGSEIDELGEELTDIKDGINNNLPIDWIVGKYIRRSDGQAIENTDYCATDYILIPIVSGKLVVKTIMTNDTLTALGFYDSEKTYISGVNTYSGSTSIMSETEVDIPQGAKYVRYTYYKRYNQYYSDSSIRVINITDMIGELQNTLYPTYKIVDIFSNIGVIDGYYINAVQRNISPLSGYSYSEIYPIKKGDRITMSNAIPAGSAVARMSKWNQSGTTLIDVLEVGTTSVTTVNYTATADVEYLRFCWYNANGATIIKVERNESEYLASFIDSQKKYTDVSMFKTIAVCGDSYTVGQIYINGNTSYTNWDNSWGRVLGRKHGVTINIYGSGGADTNTWQTRAHCLPQVLTDTPSDFYILNLGINDASLVTLGTLEDITSHQSYSEYPNTYYGNYGKIIEQIKEHASSSRIVMAKVLCPSNATVYNYSSTAIEEIADYYQIPWIETKDSKFLMSDFYNNNMVSGHPTAPLYSAIANVMSDKISDVLVSDIGYFNDWHL